MKINLFVKLYGAIIILAGVFLLSSKDVSFNTIKYTLGITLIIGAMLAIATAFTRQRKKVQFAYHIIHALSVFFYGLSVLLFADSLEMLSYLTAFLLFFYSISEIIFCNWLFNLKNKVKVKVLFIRVFLGFIAGIGTVILMGYYTDNYSIMLHVYGILIAIIGVNILLYVPIMKTRVLSE